MRSFYLIKYGDNIAFSLFQNSVSEGSFTPRLLTLIFSQELIA